MLPKSELYQVRIAVVIAAALFLVIGLSEIRIAWRTHSSKIDSLANLRTAVVFALMGLTATKELFALNLEPGLGVLNQKLEFLVRQIEEENEAQPDNSS